jgi:hypothetical protein
MALNPPRALARSHLSSPSLNPAVAGGRGTPANIDMIASVSQSAALGDAASSSSSPPPLPWPKLELDSGAGGAEGGVGGWQHQDRKHTDPRLLHNPRCLPRARTQTQSGRRAHQLARQNRISTWFVGDRAQASRRRSCSTRETREFVRSLHTAILEDHAKKMLLMLHWMEI